MVAELKIRVEEVPGAAAGNGNLYRVVGCIINNIDVYLNYWQVSNAIFIFFQEICTKFVTDT